MAQTNSPCNCVLSVVLSHENGKGNELDRTRDWILQNRDRPQRRLSTMKPSSVSQISYPAHYTMSRNARANPSEGK